MISQKIHTQTIEKVFSKYWGAPCIYLKNGQWRRGTVGHKTMHAISRRECVMLLKPLSKITSEFLGRLALVTGQEFKDEVISEQALKEYIEDLQEHIEMMPYTAADYLRKYDFHVPVYGIDLFKAGMARELDETKWKDSITYRKERKEREQEQKQSKSNPLAFNVVNDGLAVSVSNGTITDTVPVPKVATSNNSSDDDDRDLRY